MLRLTRTSRLHSEAVLDEVILVLEGQIVAEWVDLLEAECLELLGSHGKVLLDLANVSYLDGRAVRLLRRLATRSVNLINCPPLVEELVREDAS